ncbi:hypothetical protein [Paraburkholderia humisilvae]|uniref:Chemotaxis phosphatase CheX-like domain-containing protein n=1 Tax=Paraburkholderia humisilvae TaxID=627669 RepID=A0A6J5DUI9_9BURK|nr:hypothetical protein [Paraburkholderia humisilvae]CAB3756565.1 hypothetical protein LMG29542_02898 [Paraburkholderia humisilvae]
MISAQAKESFERILQKAAQTRLTVTPGDTCSIAVQGRHGAGALAADATSVVVLTISSISFRLLLILHFNEDTATVEYFTKDSAERPFREVFQEICNLCCGAINQELLRYFPDLGMSTPYMLSARCLPHLEGLKPALLETWAVTINDSVGLAATLCVCAHAPIDFTADVSVAEDTSGELELF